MNEPACKKAKIGHVLRQTSLKDLFASNASIIGEKKSVNTEQTEEEHTVIPDSPPTEEDSEVASRLKTLDPSACSQEGENMAESLESQIGDSEEDQTLDFVSGSSPPEELGDPLHSLNFGPSTYSVLPVLSGSISHCVAFLPQLPKDTPPIPHPENFRDVWDAHHVRMPCSKSCLYPVSGSLRSKWELIKHSLSRPVRTSQELEEAILGYNLRQKGNRNWNFQGLHSFFREVDRVYSDHFFHSVLPRIVDLALSLPNVVTHAVPFLKQQMDYTITLSQKQIACLLANAFLCTFPNRNSSRKHTSDLGTYPSINFNGLFSRPCKPSLASKLKCIFHYFDRVTADVPTGTVSYHRQILANPPQWEKCEERFTKLHITPSKLIEDIGIGMLQVDFANCYVGGGVIGGGCVQEEIRFVVCPELIAARLFTELLADNESLIVTGCEQFSYYRGYSDSFRWSGPFYDETVRDDWGRRCVQLVAIDAVAYRSNVKRQFSRQMCLRDLNKAYCGFMSTQAGLSGAFSAVATGNWGCGAFGGDKYLKCALQLMAASKSRRHVVYTTFGNVQFAQDLVELHRILVEGRVTVAQLWELVQAFEPVAKSTEQSLFSFVKQRLAIGAKARDQREAQSQSQSLSQTVQYSNCENKSS